MTSSTEGPDPSIIDVLASDHTAIGTLIAEARAGRGVPSEVLDDTEGRPEVDSPEAIREQLVMEAVRHFVAEEEYLLPEVRDSLPDGTATVDTAFGLNRHCERELKTLEHRRADPADIAAALDRFAELFDRHVQMTDVLCLELARTRDAAELSRLGGLALGLEQVAPTRPRTLASEASGVSTVSNLIEGFIDRIRDAYSHRGTS